jgi:hypothetical protein
MGEGFGEVFMAMYSSPVIDNNKRTTVERLEETKCPEGCAE